MGTCEEMSLSLEPWLQHSPGCASFNLYDNGRSRECDCGLDAARAEGRPSPEAGREEDLRAEVLAIFKANKMATDERLAILIAERLAPRLSPPAPEPGYEAVPVAWRVRPKGFASWTLFNSDASWTLFNSKPLFGADWDREEYEVQPLYASPVSVAISREEIAEEIWRRFAPSYEETFADCSGRSEFLLAADAILQRLSNQQGVDR